MADKEWRFLDKWAELIMTLATLIPPFLTIMSHIDGESISIAITGLLWAIFPPKSPTSGFQILDTHWLQGSLTLGFFNILFAFLVIGFIRGRSSRIKPLAAGAMTIVIPLLAFLRYLPYMILNEYFVYIGPIPIQLIIGLVLMRTLAPKEPTTPW